MSAPIDPIVAAKAATPWWMARINEFDAIEVHPCWVVGNTSGGTKIIEQCEPAQAHFWSVYGHLRTGGLDCFEDFPTEMEAVAFASKLRHAYPHLSGKGAS
jgi:hypothetical protein